MINIKNEVNERILSLCCNTMILGLLAGCGANTSNDTGSNTNGDEKTPERLTMYIGVVEEQALKLLKSLKKQLESGHDFVRMSSGEILGRVRAEKDNQKASIWYGGSGLICSCNRYYIYAQWFKTY